MMSFEAFKKCIGPLADKLSDDEIERLRVFEYRLADAMFDNWLAIRNHWQPPADEML
jgi:hypothetical protein